MDKVLVQMEIIYLLSVNTLENMNSIISHLSTKHCIARECTDICVFRSSPHGFRRGRVAVKLTGVLHIGLIYNFTNRVSK